MVDGKRYRVTVDHKPSQAEAIKLISKRLESDVPSAHGSLAFSGAYEDFMAEKHEVLSPNTRKGCKSAYKRISDGFKHLKAENSSQIHIQREINSLTRSYSPKTVKNTGGLITAILDMYCPLLHLKLKYPQAVKPELIHKNGYIYKGCASSLRKRLTKEQDRLGIPHFRFHDLRAFYASAGHEAGLSDQMLQAGGGWSSDRVMENNYRRTANDVYEKSQDVYNEMLEGLM